MAALFDKSIKAICEAVSGLCEAFFGVLARGRRNIRNHLGQIAVLPLIFMAAACSQTYTTPDGGTATAAVPKALLNIDKAETVLQEGLIDLAEASPRSVYYKSIGKVEATGFKNGLMSIVIIPLDNAKAARYFTKELTAKNFASPNGKLTLLVDLQRAWLKGSGTSLLMTYTLKGKAGQTVASFTEETSFDVPFSAIPLGKLRGYSEFFVSMNNSLAQFSRRLN